MSSRDFGNFTFLLAYFSVCISKLYLINGVIEILWIYQWCILSIFQDRCLPHVECHINGYCWIMHFKKIIVSKVALTALSICPQDKVLTEFEMGNISSTVLVFNASWLPAQDVGVATSMDWLATMDCTQYADGSVPGIIQLKCTQNKSNSHYNFTYNTTRSGRYLSHAPDPFSGEMPQDLVLSINS